MNHLFKYTPVDNKMIHTYTHSQEDRFIPRFDRSGVVMMMMRDVIVL